MYKVSNTEIALINQYKLCNKCFVHSLPVRELNELFNVDCEQHEYTVQTTE